MEGLNGLKKAKGQGRGGEGTNSRLGDEIQDSVGRPEAGAARRHNPPRSGTPCRNAITALHHRSGSSSIG